mmetsp:Transcript_34902/g.103659  ORF Transcript_34902/g.103659 Transcript_34902/m.103659 type:complete len:225 (-) Transcript_34902:39-713(-)
MQLWTWSYAPFRAGGSKRFAQRLSCIACTCAVLRCSSAALRSATRCLAPVVALRSPSARPTQWPASRRRSSSARCCRNASIAARACSRRALCSRRRRCSSSCWRRPLSASFACFSCSRADRHSATKRLVWAFVFACRSHSSGSSTGSSGRVASGVLPASATMRQARQAPSNSRLLSRCCWYLANHATCATQLSCVMCGRECCSSVKQAAPTFCWNLVTTRRKAL